MAESCTDNSADDLWYIKPDFDGENTPLTMQLLRFFIYSAFAVSTFCATVQNVLNDFATLKTSLTTLDNAIIAFPNTSGTLLQVLVRPGQHVHHVAPS